VISAVVALIDIEEAQRLYKYHWRDLFNHLVAFAVTFGWGLEWGVVAALASSCLTVIIVTIRPAVVLLGRVDENYFPPVPLYPGKWEKRFEKAFWYNRDTLSEEPVAPAGGIIFRIDAPLYFLNVAHCFTKLAKFEKVFKAKGDKLEWVIFDMKNVTDVDATAIEGLIAQIQHHKSNGIWFALADMNLHVRQQLKDANVLPKHIPDEIIFRSIALALRKRIMLNKAPDAAVASEEDVELDNDVKLSSKEDLL